MASIQLVGLGAPLGAARGAGVGRLGQVRLNPRPRELLDHIPPAGAALQRERGLPAGELLQPHPQVLTVGRGELAALALAAVAVDPVEGDLAAVHVKPTYDSHRDLLRAPPTGLQHDHPCLSRRGSLYMSSFRMKSEVQVLPGPRYGRLAAETLVSVTTGPGSAGCMPAR